jgi:hypothetical protein
MGPVRAAKTDETEVTAKAGTESETEMETGKAVETAK